MPDSHAPLGEGIIRIKIQKVPVLFWFSYINGGKKRDGQTTFRHGDIGLAVLHRDQGKIAESVFRDDLADILAYFLTWNAGDQGLVFQMMKRKTSGDFDGIFFRTRNKTGQGMERRS